MKKSLCFCLIIFCFSCLFGNEFFSGDFNTPLEFSFQAYKNPSVTEEWKYSVSITDEITGQVISDTQKYSFEIGSDDLNGENPLFSVAYKTNSVKYPITFRIEITKLVNDDTQKSVAVKYKLGNINIKYSKNDDDHQNWSQNIENSFGTKYTDEINSNYGSDASGSESSEPITIKFYAGDELANSEDGRICINRNYWRRYFADATFSFDVYANSEDFSSATDGTYRMNVAVTVEAEGL